MYRITVMRGNIVVAVEFNSDQKQGRENARMRYGNRKMIVEAV